MQHDTRNTLKPLIASFLYQYAKCTKPSLPSLPSLLRTVRISLNASGSNEDKVNITCLNPLLSLR